MARLTRSTQIPVMLGLNSDTFGDYVADRAKEYGIPEPSAWALFVCLGVEEAQDGFLSELRDLAAVAAEEVA